MRDALTVALAAAIIGVLTAAAGYGIGAQRAASPTIAVGCVVAPGQNVNASVERIL